MEQPQPEYSYAVQVGKHEHRYALAGRRLSYRCSGSEVVWTIDLERNVFSLKKRFVTQPLFRAGLALVVCPLFTLAVLSRGEGPVLDGRVWTWVHLGMLAAGMVLVVLYRKIYRTWFLRTRSGDGVLIFRDPERPEVAEQFVAQVARLWYDGGAYFERA